MEKKFVSINGKKYPKESLISSGLSIIWLLASQWFCYKMLFIASIDVNLFLVVLSLIFTYFFFRRIQADWNRNSDENITTKESLLLHDKEEKYLKIEKIFRALFHGAMLLILFAPGSDTTEAALARFGIFGFCLISLGWNIVASKGYSSSSTEDKKYEDKAFQLGWGKCPNCLKKISRGASKCPYCTADLG